MNTNFFTWFETENIEVMEGNTHKKPIKAKGKLLSKKYPIILKTAALAALLTTSTMLSSQNRKIRSDYDIYEAETEEEFKEIMGKRKDLRTFIDTTKYFKTLEDDFYLSGLKDSIINRLDIIEERIEKDKDDKPIYKSYNNMVIFSAYKNLNNLAKLTTNSEKCPSIDILYNLRNLEIEEKPAGVHDWSSPIAGKYSKQYNDFFETVERDEKLNNDLKIFASGLYTSNTARFSFFDDFSEEECQQVERISKRKYFEWAQKMEADTTKMVLYGQDESNAGTANQFSAVSIGMDKMNVYPGVEIHELRHLSQFKIGSDEMTKGEASVYHSDKKDITEDKINIYSELGPTLEQLIICDEIYKEVKGIPIDSVVNYPIPLTFQNGVQQDVGPLVNTMRNIMNEGKYCTYEQVILTKKGRKFIDSIVNPVNKENYVKQVQEQNKLQSRTDSIIILKAIKDKINKSH